jgi:MazG family protein
MDNRFDELVKIMKKLRGPEGCPWDREQTLETLKKSLIEECYEVLEVMDENNPDELKKELGDLLLQIVFQSEIMDEEGKFNIYDVAESISEKLIRRHPHIFGEITVKNSDEVAKNWEEIKKREKEHEHRVSILDGIPKGLPSLEKAYKIQSKVRKVGFEFETVDDAFDKILEELSELKEAYRNNEKEEIRAELGDMIFSIVNVSRMLEIDPSSALIETNKKFEQRFRYIEEKCNIDDTNIEEMDKLWNEAKYVYKQK